MDSKSQHIDSIELYKLLRNEPISCDPTLGVQLLNILKGASPGVGGATLMSAEIDNNPIVIKAFPTDCPLKYFNGQPRPNNNMRDYGDYEPGTGLLLTEKFIVPSLTQNITTCYNLSICDYAYEGQISPCKRQQIPELDTFPIQKDCALDLKSYTPLCPMGSIYNSMTQRGHIEIPARDDTVRFMMVEKCSGDIQGLIEGYRDADESQRLYLMNTLYLMCLMIFHTLILLDSLLNGYTHKDLGARNVLYTWDPHQRPNTYWRYTFPSGNSTISIDIPTSTLIPKIWDFSFVRFGTANEYKDYYSYLTPVTVPSLDKITQESRANDVFIILNDISHLLRANDIIDTKFNHLMLDRIRSLNNNTAAVYEFLSQYPIENELLAHASHEIIHTFSIDSNMVSLERDIVRE